MIRDIVTEEIDLKQAKSKMVMNIKANRPIVIIKDYPHSEKYFEVDLGEISVSCTEQYEAGRFHKYPKKLALTNTFLIGTKDLGIKFQPAGVDLTNPFSVNVDFTNLAYSTQLIKVSSKELDKSFKINVELVPKLHLSLRQDVYTFLLRCIDLNFAYTDGLEAAYNFRNTEEYFKSTAFILKTAVHVRTHSVNLSIFESQETLLTELAIKEPNIIINMYLNN